MMVLTWWMMTSWEPRAETKWKIRERWVPLRYHVYYSLLRLGEGPRGQHKKNEFLSSMQLAEKRWLLTQFDSVWEAVRNLWCFAVEKCCLTAFNPSLIEKEFGAGQSVQVPLPLSLGSGLNHMETFVPSMFSSNQAGRKETTFGRAFFLPKPDMMVQAIISF